MLVSNIVHLQIERCSEPILGNVADAHVLAADKIHPNSPDKDIVSGEAFFITDGAPVQRDRYIDTCYKLLGDDGQGYITLPLFIGYIIVWLGMVRYFFTGKLPLLHWYEWKTMTTTQWYSCEKVRSSCVLPICLS